MALHAVAHAAARNRVTELADLTLEQLSNIEVTSVSGRGESLQDAAASIYVITGEDIRRSAATSLPEALRLAPNLEVAQLNAAQYAISARGFNNAIGNKLLVLVDGRTIYSPLFSGVFWDNNDVMLEDIDRIEVVSGPGGTLWGANAVNGVINVITKPAAQTQGLLVTGARSFAGGYEAGRVGGRFGDDGAWRGYAMAMDHSSTERADGVTRPDAAAKRQAGFRADWSAAAGRFTLQGDAYQGGKDPANNLAPRMSGANLLGRWEGRFAGGTPFKLQAYLDYYDRDDVIAFRDRSKTADIQFTSEPRLGPGRQLLWGAGYRETQGSNDPSPLVLFIPAEKTMRWGNVFAQHEWRIGKWDFTLGAKIESNVYSGLEFMPNARVSYKHSATQMTWAALSRAVRAPARLDREFFSPGKPPFIIGGGPDFQPEVANVAEIGHRGYLTKGLSYSATVFRQQYDRLRSGTSTLPARLVNQIEGHVDGVEAWGTWQAARDWRLSAGLVVLNEHFHSTRGTPDPSGVANLGNDPHLQWNVRSSLNISPAGEFDVIVRHVGALPVPAVPAYTAVDARFAWRVSRELELALLGQNLFDARHHEFNAIAAASQIERRVFLKATWRM
jgi:iron complex outermembrane receptor protein